MEFPAELCCMGKGKYRHFITKNDGLALKHLEGSGLVSVTVNSVDVTIRKQQQARAMARMLVLPR